MNQNNLDAIKAINAILVLIVNASGAISKINALLATAHNEGRDITDEELKAITDATDAKHQEVVDKLKELGQSGV